MVSSLKNKIVLVTGASGGLGQALCERFVEQGCFVWMASRNRSQLDALALQLGERTMPVYLDVTKYDSHLAVAQEIMRVHGKIEVWVNNAGLDRCISLADISPAILEEITAVNYFGVVYGTQVASQYMKRAGTGDIVQILSTSAFTPRANEAPYCAAKAAANVFSESVALGLKPHGIRVIPVYPGGMATPFFEKSGLSQPKDAIAPEAVAAIVINALEQPRNVVIAPIIYRQETPFKRA